MFRWVFIKESVTAVLCHSALALKGYFASMCLKFLPQASSVPLESFRKLRFVLVCVGNITNRTLYWGRCVVFFCIQAWMGEIPERQEDTKRLCGMLMWAVAVFSWRAAADSGVKYGWLGRQEGRLIQIIGTHRHSVPQSVSCCQLCRSNSMRTSCTTINFWSANWHYRFFWAWPSLPLKLTVQVGGFYFICYDNQCTNTSNFY